MGGEGFLGGDWRLGSAISAMRIYGIDFTSRPGKRKPITCASGLFVDKALIIESIENFTSFAEFEVFLATPGPWRAGMDFPFGQPRKLIHDAGWPNSWAAYVKTISRMSNQDFYDFLQDYQNGHGPKEKRLFRSVDRLAGACSPMQLHFTPLAKMFYEGASRLLKSGICILPVCQRDDSRTAIEAYPKLVAKRYANSEKYKVEGKTGYDIALRKTREQILNGLKTHAERDFGFRIRIGSNPREQASENQSGDCIDAVLCAVQATWSKRNKNPRDGIPVDCDKLEGWIVDPGLLKEPLPHLQVDALDFGNP